MKFAVFWVNFGMPHKSCAKTEEFPAAHPLAGGGVLVAVDGPSPSLGGRAKRRAGGQRAVGAVTARATPLLRGEPGGESRLGRPEGLDATEWTEAE